MLVAGAVNLAMLLVAATNLQGRDNTDSIEGAYAAVRDTLGPTVALLFAIGLLASGLASTSVGAYAGAMIMQGLLRGSVPLLVRRLVTLIPALVILAVGVDPSRALVLSQVVLSFGIPFALIPLVRLTSDRDPDGRGHQPPRDHGPGVDGRRVDYCAECGAHLSDREGLNAQSPMSPGRAAPAHPATSRTGPTCACSRWRGDAPTPSTRGPRRSPITTG